MKFILSLLLVSLFSIVSAKDSSACLAKCKVDNKGFGPILGERVLRWNGDSKKSKWAVSFNPWAKIVTWTDDYAGTKPTTKTKVSSAYFNKISLNDKDLSVTLSSGYKSHTFYASKTDYEAMKPALKQI